MSTRIMKQPSFGSRRHEHDEEPDFNLTDWGLKAKISRENTNSRRFSASYIRSFREDAKSFRSNLTISSTASSPGYNLKEEIDPSTYSFTTALKALQAKTVYSWEYMSPEGLALNSKWDEAEKYICNPLSGEVPMECLSAKTLSGRSFRQLTSRITMSAPLIYPARQAAKPPMPPPLEINQPHTPIPTQEKKIGVTRDVGTQSGTPPLPYLGSSSSPSPVPTPSIEERSIKRHASESPSSCAKPKSEEEEEEEEETEELKSGTTREEEDVTGRDELEEKTKGEKEKEKVRSSRQGGCLSWRSFLWMRKRQRRREKHRPRKKNNIFLCPIHEC